MKNVLVVMSTYNGEKFIKEQLDSIINQTYKNIEIIVRDDGSKDNTVNIITKNFFITTKENKLSRREYRNL